MSIEDRLESLRTKHAALEAALENETHRPSPDDVQIHELKRQKLRLKDEMHRLSP
ncbi:MAG: YdcH family protein [Alphaproteobacteria bacterium]|nr:YdcH family protein [Alphaproteobacteria bacterium]